MGSPTYNHVRRALHLHLTMGGQTCHHVIKVLHLHPTMGGLSYHHVGKAHHLYLTMEGTNPTMSERLLDSSPPLGGNLDLENTKLLAEVLKLHSGQWLGQHISYLFSYCNILELQ